MASTVALMSPSRTALSAVVWSKVWAVVVAEDQVKPSDRPAAGPSGPDAVPAALAGAGVSATAVSAPWTSASPVRAGGVLRHSATGTLPV